LFAICLATLLEELGQQTPVYCFPNPNSLKGTLRAGFKPITECFFWLRPAKPKLYEHNRPSASSRQDSGRSFQLSGLDLTDPEMIEWRFKTRPGVTYSIVDMKSAKVIYRILRLGPIKVAVILAAQAANLDDWNSLQNHTVDTIANEGAHAILEFGHVPTPLRRAFIRVPTHLLRRSFPVVQRNVPGSFSQLGAADWDVL
jgi:hypothetical protein